MHKHEITKSGRCWQKIVIFIDLEKNKRLPDAIGKMIHLRYLNMSSSYICAFPPSIGNLQGLQTLEFPQDIEESIISLPHEICNAKQLRHFIGAFRWPFRVNNLTNLRTLKWVVVGDQMESNPMDLINIQELDVYVEGNGKRFN